MARILALLILSLSPKLALAASIAGPQCSSIMQNTKCLAQGIGNILMYGTGILVGIAIIFYFWGIVRGFWNAEAGNTKSLETMRTQMLWGFGALFLILTIWGVLSLIGNVLFGTNNFNSLF